MKTTSVGFSPVKLPVAFLGANENIVGTSTKSTANADEFVSAIHSAIKNPEAIAKDSNLRGRVYVAISSFMDKNTPNNGAKNKLETIATNFEKTFGIQATKKNIKKFHKECSNIMTNFSSLTPVEQAKTMPQNCQKVIKVFLDYFGKIKV